MSELYIAHHGIKGQKWGERNGPPYPLEGHTRNQKKNFKQFAKDWQHGKLSDNKTFKRMRDTEEYKTQRDSWQKVENYRDQRLSENNPLEEDEDPKFMELMNAHLSDYDKYKSVGEKIMNEELGDLMDQPMTRVMKTGVRDYSKLFAPQGKMSFTLKPRTLIV